MLLYAESLTEIMRIKYGESQGSAANHTQPLFYGLRHYIQTVRMGSEITPCCGLCVYIVLCGTCMWLWCDDNNRATIIFMAKLASSKLYIYIYAPFDGDMKPGTKLAVVHHRVSTLDHQVMVTLCRLLNYYLWTTSAREDGYVLWNIHTHFAVVLVCHHGDT